VTGRNERGIRLPSRPWPFGRLLTMEFFMTSCFANNANRQANASTMKAKPDDAGTYATAPPTGDAAAAKTRRSRVLNRLWAAAELQIGEIEGRLKALGGEGADIEREARTLAILARVVRELTAPKRRAAPLTTAAKRAATGRTGPTRGRAFPAISRTEAGEGENAGPVRNLDHLREELARHLQRLQDEAAAARAAGTPE
jgi:hypothetical protein